MSHWEVWARVTDAVGLNVCENAVFQGPRGQAGWSLGINYTTLADLQTQLTDRTGTDHVMRLAISAHGSDIDGTPGHGAGPETSPTARIGSFALEGVRQRQLHVGNIAEYDAFFRFLNGKLEANADVYLAGCSVAATTPGRTLLVAISRQLPGRRIVGFIQQLRQAEPNQFRGGTIMAGACDEPGLMDDSGRFVSWASSSAVWARNGAIRTIN
jgi:hypothetical protein